MQDEVKSLQEQLAKANERLAKVDSNAKLWKLEQELMDLYIEVAKYSRIIKTYNYLNSTVWLNYSGCNNRIREIFSEIDKLRGGK